MLVGLPRNVSRPVTASPQGWPTVLRSTQACIGAGGSVVVVLLVDEVVPSRGVRGVGVVVVTSVVPGPVVEVGAAIVVSGARPPPDPNSTNRITLARDRARRR